MGKYIEGRYKEFVIKIGSKFLYINKSEGSGREYLSVIRNHENNYIVKTDKKEFKGLSQYKLKETLTALEDWKLFLDKIKKEVFDDLEDLLEKAEWINIRASSYKLQMYVAGQSDVRKKFRILYDIFG